MKIGLMIRIGAAAVLLGALVPRGGAMGGAPMTPDDVLAECQAELFALNAQAVGALQAELAQFADDFAGLPPDATGVDAAKVGAAASARLEKVGLASIAMINKTANKCIAKLNRMGADPSYANGTDALRLNFVTILTDSLRFSGQAAIATAMVDFTDK